ncbi:MAG: hypothetical protein GX117_04110 [Candidatus Hydrogenedentes bacterium]|nr:hypothetical protein [Candidatus Hydrogenedentota bacterium]
MNKLPAASQRSTLKTGAADFITLHHDGYRLRQMNGSPTCTGAGKAPKACLHWVTVSKMLPLEKRFPALI